MEKVGGGHGGIQAHFGIYLISIISETTMKTAYDSPARAKLFMHGRSQAVRLPKEFRFEGTEVYVRRVGADVVLSSRPKAAMQSLLDAVAEFEPGFVMERAQPTQTDLRDTLFAPAKH